MGGYSADRTWHIIHSRQHGSRLGRLKVGRLKGMRPLIRRSETDDYFLLCRVIVRNDTRPWKDTKRWCF